MIIPISNLLCGFSLMEQPETQKEPDTASFFQSWFGLFD